MPKTKDYQYWLYEHLYESSDSFLNYVTSLVKDSNIRINVLLVTTISDIKRELEEWVPEKFDIKINNRQSVFTLEITKTIDEKNKLSAKAVIVTHPIYPAVYLVVSDCTTGDFKNVITQLLNKHYPTISQIYLTNNEMRIIFNRLREATDLDLIVEFSVGKKRLPKSKKKESQVTYTNQPYEEVFEEILAHDQWVHSIRYRAERVKTINEMETRTIEFAGIISRACFFSSRKDFVPLIKTIIPNAIKLVSVRNEYLKISAESAAEPKPEPIVIKFDENIFSDSKKNQQYIDALVELESCSLSEYHTNPYIHVSMLDYLDGSSYDIWALAADRLVIIPQFSASTAALGRLVNHIFERIHEGEIKKYEPIEINAKS